MRAKLKLVNVLCIVLCIYACLATPTNNTAGGDRGVPMEITTSWPVGDNVRMNANCVFDISENYEVNEFKVKVVFSSPTNGYLDWSWLTVDESASGEWYYRSNKYNLYPPNVTFAFQVSAVGSAPPTGRCFADGGVVVVTTDTPTGGTRPTTETPTKETSTIETSTMPLTGDGNYTEVLGKSIMFYRAQRSGDLPEVANDPLSWRKDSALYDGDDVGLNLTGGWYDAGDYVKFNLPISAAVTVLSWGLVQWKDAYLMAGQYHEMLDSIKWPLDFFLECWREDQDVFYAQVGDGDIDHAWMGRPEDMTKATVSRPAYKVDEYGGGSDVAGNVAAAFAAGSIAFKEKDPAYSATLLKAAKSLYVFADTYRALYMGQVPDANSFYKSSGYGDELVYAAAMLYKATGKARYLRDAENKHTEFGFDGQSAWAFDWDNKIMGAKLLLYEATKKSKYSQDVKTFMGQWRPGGSVDYTDGGLAWLLEWGTLRYSANAAFIALMAADQGIDAGTNAAWAQTQIRYMMGDNPRSSSYVVGYGNNPPRRPHHKSSTCQPKPAPCGWVQFDADVDNAHVLYGALVGGPTINDDYVDDRKDYKMAEVTCDYNAGFQSAVAGLLHFGIVSK